jgi:hypothetical protein
MPETDPLSVEERQISRESKFLGFARPRMFLATAIPSFEYFAHTIHCFLVLTRDGRHNTLLFPLSRLHSVHSGSTQNQGDRFVSWRVPDAEDVVV